MPNQRASHEHHHHHQHSEETAAATTATDPVCGMQLDPHTAQHRASHGGQTYYFCSAKCRETFVAHPEQYVGESKAAASAPAGTIYTCPMHPQVRQVGPGTCPICGMTLEPVSYTHLTLPTIYSV